MARLTQSLAELFKNSLSDDAQALESYKAAADLYETNNNPASAKACLQEAAILCMKEKLYSEASSVYEKVANDSVGTVSRFGVKQVLLRAGLCTFAQGDVVAAQRAIAKYKDLDASFSTTIECALLEALLTSIQTRDEEQFSAAVTEYDTQQKLDPILVKVLLDIKAVVLADELEL